MIESFMLLTAEHESIIHVIFFCLLMLAGLNIPISEDILLLSAGFLAASGPAEGVLPLYITLFFGCWISAWEAYALGRFLGPKVYQMRFLKHVVTERRVEHFKRSLERFGVFTFIFGRFIPGGVRNVIFMGAGLGKMPFLTFIMRDGLGCLLSSMTLFYLGMNLKVYKELLENLFLAYRVVSISVLFLLCCLTLFFIFFKKSGVQSEKTGKL